MIEDCPYGCQSGVCQPCQPSCIGLECGDNGCPDYYWTGAEGKPKQNMIGPCGGCGTSKYCIAGTCMSVDPDPSLPPADGTGLVFEQPVSLNTVDWNGALAHCDGMNSQVPDGNNDWRLPTIDELQTTLTFVENDHGCYCPDDFHACCKNANFWSSSQLNSTQVWIIDTGNGKVKIKAKTSTYRVRCVRGP